MLTGELRSKIDTVWNAFWAGGIANPIEVIEQITYLLFMRGLDEAQALADNKANRTGRPVERSIFPAGKDGIGKNGGVAFVDMRWSLLKNRDPATMFAIVAEHVFPFPARHGRGGLVPCHAHEGRALSPFRRRRCSPRSSISSPSCRWRIATPRATSTNTC